MAKTVLVVDDENDIRVFLKTLLEDNGYSAITAEDGEAGYSIAKKEKPSLICLDISMPNVSGVKAYRNLCDDSETKDIPVVMITGISPEFEDFIKNRKQVKPPAAYFEKPIDKDEFIKTVNELTS